MFCSWATTSQKHLWAWGTVRCAPRWRSLTPLGSFSSSSRGSIELFRACPRGNHVKSAVKHQCEVLDTWGDWDWQVACKVLMEWKLSSFVYLEGRRKKKKSSLGPSLYVNTINQHLMHLFWHNNRILYLYLSSNWKTKAFGGYEYVWREGLSYWVL